VILSHPTRLNDKAAHRYNAVLLQLGRDGIWKTSQSFSRNEIPLATYTLQRMFEAMIEKRPGGEGGEQQEVA